MPSIENQALKKTDAISDQAVVASEGNIKQSNELHPESKFKREKFCELVRFSSVLGNYREEVRSVIEDSIYLVESIQKEIVSDSNPHTGLLNAEALHSLKALINKNIELKEITSDLAEAEEIHGYGAFFTKLNRAQDKIWMDLFALRAISFLERFFYETGNFVTGAVCFIGASLIVLGNFDELLPLGLGFIGDRVFRRVAKVLTGLVSVSAKSHLDQTLQRDGELVEVNFKEDLKLALRGFFSDSYRKEIYIKHLDSSLRYLRSTQQKLKESLT